MAGGIFGNVMGTPALAPSRDDAIRAEVLRAQAEGEARANVQAPGTFEGMLDAHRADPRGTAVLGAIMEGLNAGGQALGNAGQGAMTPEAYGTLVPHAVATLGGAGAPSTARAGAEAAAVGDSLLGVFGARMAPEQRQAAQSALNAGGTAREVKAATGVERSYGPDGQLLREIDDSTAALTPNWTKAKTLGEAITHPELYEAYPELAGAPFRAGFPIYDPRRLMFRGMEAGYAPGKNGKPGKFIVNPQTDDPLGSLIHEIQHGVQHADGRESGSNFNEALTHLGVKSAPRDKVYETYLANGGEAEAHATMSRIDLTPAERAQRLQQDDYIARNRGFDSDRPSGLWYGSGKKR